MRLVDLLETAKETQDIIIRDDWALGIIYNKKFNFYFNDMKIIVKRLNYL